MLADTNRNQITVVTGLPRTGTSLMMQMLRAGGLDVLIDDARKPDPDNPKGYYEFDPVKRTARDQGWVAAAGGKAVKVIHIQLRHLPAGADYRVIIMNRDLREVLASQAAMLHRRGERGADLPPDRLAEVFGSQLQRMRDWIASQPQVTALDVQHRQVIADPIGVAAAVSEFLGGVIDPVRAAAAVDPGLYRQRLTDGASVGLPG